ncbi:GTP 3',8-cyclase MoaA [Agathobaculum sp.]|uniref:GTP 3',8-cyclase MoaA n=1 Tax=Agathobaculum sp. TaxID=2048138 RepID=UPI002A81F187|nr:GTP 3',8-cyclase MoaA [Agathobaculum sp.]MDY3618704.1 GTP 3',8-cyclase MoaA [Agathobaculum sp.]
MWDGRGRLVDYLRISLTDRCNLRCVYCMPETGVKPLPHEQILTFEELTRLAACFSKLGIRKIKLTGGEPLVRLGMVKLVRALREVGSIEQITLTTNGVLLAQHLDALLHAGLDAVNISLDTLEPARFARITRSDGLERVLDAIRRASSAGLPVKINCVPLMGLNEQDVVPLAGLARELVTAVRFIELMPIGCGAAYTAMPFEQLRSMLETAYGALTPFDGSLGNGPAQYCALKGFSGKIGFIRAVSDEFCHSCNRVRLAADGGLKTCLHQRAAVNLRDMIRTGASDEAICACIGKALEEKPDGHHFGCAQPNDEARFMVSIGG